VIRAVWLVVVTACSVPDVNLANKLCPCIAGYACVANHCVKNNPGSDAGNPSCLGSDPGTILYTDNFDGAVIDSGWITTTMWAQTGGQLVQSDGNDQLAFAYTTRVSQANYRVVAQMAGTAGGTGMGLVARNTAGMKTMYNCLWEPGTTGALVLESTNNGGVAMTLASQVGIPSGGATETVTMELLAVGTELRCCLDNIAGAMVSVSNPTPSFSTGQPGVITNRMEAQFDNFAVYAQ
jgi:hypothetical protein